MDTMIFIAQTLLTSYLALWLLLGLRDNILYPSLNGLLTTQVLQLERLKEEFPDGYGRGAEFKQAYF